MSIKAYTGMPGAGKSYNVFANVVLPAIERGRVVVSNIPVNREEFDDDYPEADYRYFQQSEVETAVAKGKDWWKLTVPGGAVVVIDEAGLLWPSGSKANNVPSAHKEFIAMHRHRVGEMNGEQYSLDVVLCVQSTTDLAAWVRSKVSKTYIFTKLDAVGAEKTYVCQIYQGCQDTMKPRRRDEIRKLTGSYQGKVFRYYQSHTQGGDEGLGVNERSVDDSANVFRSSKFVGGVIALVLLLGVFVWGASATAQKYFGEAEPVEVADGEGDKPETAEAAPTRVRPVEKKRKSLSPVWKVAAHVSNYTSLMVFIKATDGRTRTIRTKNVCRMKDEEPECVIDGERVTYYSGGVTRRIFGR